jgi:hypothetical protein
MRKRTLLLSITVTCIAAAAAFGWVTIRRGFSARDNPSAIETLVATTARQLAVPSQYRQLRNPLSSSSDLHPGMEHFADHCATCHANDGSGDTLFGKGFYPKPPDMRQKETQNKSDGELYYTIESGIRLMHLVLACISIVLIWLVWWLHFRARRKALVLPHYRLALEVLAVGVIALTGHLGGFLSGVNGPG